MSLTCFDCMDTACASQGRDVPACDDFTAEAIDEYVPPTREEYRALLADFNRLRDRVIDADERIRDMERAAADLIKTFQGGSR